MKRHLLAVTALAFGISTLTAHAQSTNPQPARRIWHGSILNITKSIDPLTILLPKVTGQYHLSLYSSIQQGDAVGQSIYTVTTDWYDPGPGPETAAIQMAGNAARPYAYAIFEGSFRTALQTPITITVTKSANDLSIAAVYWTHRQTAFPFFGFAHFQQE